MVRHQEIEQWTLDGHFVKRYDSLAHAAQAMGCDKTSISGAYRGKHPVIKGFLWKPTPQDDLPGEYWDQHPTLDVRVSCLGRVEYASGSRTFGALSAGYMTVRIGRGSYRVHRLVMETFFPAAKEVAEAMVEEGWGVVQVNHLDYDPQNNHIDNLEWVTPKQNCTHRSQRSFQ